MEHPKITFQSWNDRFLPKSLPFITDIPFHFSKLRGHISLDNKVKTTLVNSTEAFGRLEVHVHSVLTSALDGDVVNITLRLLYSGG